VIFFLEGKFVLHVSRLLGNAHHLSFTVALLDFFLCLFPSLGEPHLDFVLFTLPLLNHLHLLSIQEHKVAVSTLFPLSRAVVLFYKSFGVDQTTIGALLSVVKFGR